MGNKKILILFDGPHLAFSPTTIQLYDELTKQHNVTIIAQDPNNFNGQELNNRNVFYHRYYGVKSRYIYLLFFKFLLLFNENAKLFKQNGFDYKDYFFRYVYIKRFVRKNNFDRILCVDIRNLFFCSLLKLKVDFVSLELCKDEHLWRIINKTIINCVIIQSIDRYNYLFKDNEFTVFYIQNAPNFKEIELKQNRKGLIYTGTANEAFCFYHFLNFLLKNKEETLTVQGAIMELDKKRINEKYQELLTENRLILSLKYLENDDVVNFLTDYEIGLCFYNFEDEGVKRNYFNYATAPSGKLFKYLAAGVPVVCNKIVGFKFVAEFDCGILLAEPNEEAISAAIQMIRDNYEYYVENCIKAAQYFSFDKAIIPYQDFVSFQI